jgi:hypothetical protein
VIAILERRGQAHLTGQKAAVSMTDARPVVRAEAMEAESTSDAVVLAEASTTDAVERVRVEASTTDEWEPVKVEARCAGMGQSEMGQPAGRTSGSAEKMAQCVRKARGETGRCSTDASRAPLNSLEARVWPDGWGWVAMRRLDRQPSGAGW